MFGVVLNEGFTACSRSWTSYRVAKAFKLDPSNPLKVSNEG